jgi:hypothetical protein
MKLDKIGFARLVNYLGQRITLSNSELEDLDSLIDFDVTPEKVYIGCANVDELLRQIINPDGFIPAIKAYRALTGAGLKEAKEAVERYRVTPKFNDEVKPDATLGDILKQAST